MRSMPDQIPFYYLDLQTKIIHTQIALSYMQADLQTSDSTNQQRFVKGMTLEQYMSQINLQNTSAPQNLDDQKQQNLYESSLDCPHDNWKINSKQYRIDQIDEESSEDSIQYQNNGFTKKYQKQQQTKETSRQTKYAHEIPRFSDQPNSAFRRTTVHMNSQSNEKNSFRIKHVSNSPYKKKAQPTLPQAVLTLYGNKFRQSPRKESTNVPELVTFYGRMHQATDEVKADFTKKESKRNFKKGSHLQINELIEFETKIKNNYSQKIYLKDIRIDGIKDKLTERRNKLC